MKIHPFALAFFTLSLALGGCAARNQRTVVILLPDDKGSVGQVEVSTDAGSLILDEPGEATEVGSPAAPPAEPFLMEEGEVRDLFASALDARPPRPATFVLYFLRDSADLTEKSLALLEEVIAEVEARDSADISVVGHTDRTGDEEYNLKLSTERAGVVRDLLVRRGMDPASLHVTSHGEENPLVPTADGVAEPLNRRVEVTVR